jgi:PAS domain S-box-containing protein
MEIDLGRLVNSLPGLVWTAGPDGEAEMLGERWFAYTGLTREEAAGDGWRQAVHPDDRARLQSRWTAVLKSKEPAEMEVRLRRADGVYRWHLFRATPLRGDKGEAGWCGVGIDIEDQKRALSDLAARDEHYRAVADSIPSMISFMTPQGGVESINRHLSEYVGATIEDLEGYAVTKVVHPDDLERVIGAWMHAVETGEPYDIEHRIRRADGVFRWFHTHALPLRDAEGQTLRWYCLQTDIDDRYRAEALLKGEKRLLEMVARGVALRDVLSELCRQAEASAPESLCSILVIDPAGTRFQIGDGASLPEGYAALLERPILAGGGQTLGVFSLYRRGAEPPTPAELDLSDRFTDIAGIAIEHERADAALNRARADLTHMARVTALSALTASIAHEVSQPLSGIITNASTCLRMLAADPLNLEVARATAQRTIRDANRATEVIQRLRALFAKRAPAREEVDLNDAAREVLALSQSELQRRRVAVRTDFADALPRISGDRVQLQQVMLNLVLNAADALEGVEGRPRDLLMATRGEASGEVRLFVRDAGVGLDPAGAERLFDAFYTTKGQGMGIGLSISRTIIEGHDGRLWASANDGPGATFSFSIPATRTAGDA